MRHVLNVGGGNQAYKQLHSHPNQYSRHRPAPTSASQQQQSSHNYHGHHGGGGGGHHSHQYASEHQRHSSSSAAPMRRAPPLPPPPIDAPCDLECLLCHKLMMSRTRGFHILWHLSNDLGIIRLERRADRSHFCDWRSVHAWTVINYG